ncbi:MAG: DUF302 domain-containing protein [Candidatus Marinimicrobia bacterium]|nr:DUF302 domain-containing protein [Candidatus Neomarinimicrobiota bacterium]MCF7839917.1 DUF302 domain-containing protein [Candidatus Neomarinimicrobiota bacterium]MCF7902004.1 DUF302 domain-containing protein [Candidatus Neomarinimicrobiota bacterium]
MSYHFSKTLSLSMEDAVTRTKEVLAKSGFGVVSEIDMSATLKKKIGAEIYPYRILGACSPGHAHIAITAESHIGLMLPCNVIVREFEPGKCEVSAIDPIASMQAVENNELSAVSRDIQDRLKMVINTL